MILSATCCVVRCLDLLCFSLKGFDRLNAHHFANLGDFVQLRDDVGELR